MPRTCTICTHTKRREIDRALVAGEPYRSIAKHFGASAPAVLRHREHLPARLVRAQEARDAAQADTLLDQLRTLQERTLEILRKAESAGDLRTATAAIGQARQNLELLGRMAGELRDGTTVNILVNPQWVTLQAVILAALDQYPEAKEAVSRALVSLNGEGE